MRRKLAEDLIKAQYKEIKDSIQYALRIQTAILPPQKVVKQYLENSFILYKPKDIVAGDFYWMESVGIADSKFQIGIRTEIDFAPYSRKSLQANGPSSFRYQTFKHES